VTIPTRVRRAAYRFAYTVLRALWFVFRPRTSGVKCVITDHELVLLVLHTYGTRWWDLPGGTPKRDEPPIRTASREMAEELGLEVADWNDIGELQTTIHHRRDTLHCFRAELASPAITIDPVELAAARWFTRAEVADAPPRRLAPHVAEILERAPVAGAS
jgi:8-oxo-dGTP pyrophosphatase MutT (NUDIX family)